MLKRILLIMLVIAAVSLSVLTVASYKTNSCGTPPLLKQTDDDFEAYREFVALPIKDRRMAYGQLSAERKSFFWRQHLTTCLRDLKNLTQEQKNLILEGISLATPEWFGTPTQTSEWETKVGESLRSFDQRIRSAFSRKDGAKTFAQIGPTTLENDQTPTCQCSTISDWCWWRTYCKGGGCYWTDGCGTFGWYGCTGMCVSSSDS
jgi:hypothetical protein